MTFQNYRDASRTNWGTEDDKFTLEQINTGAILRIADAAEKMAIRHTELIRERDSLSATCKRRDDQITRLERSNASLRGQITKLKKAAAKEIA